MGIYDPRLFLTRNDVELLQLLSNLLLEFENQPQLSNRPLDQVALSQSEARRLLELLEQFVESKKFVEGAYFIEHLFGGDDPYDLTLKDIYLGWRKRQGRSRALATVHWRNFINRLGLVKEPSGYYTGGYIIQAEKMELDYFIRMETKLLNTTKIDPRVVKILIAFVEARLNVVEKIRSRQERLQSGSLKKSLLPLLEKIGARQGIQLDEPSLTANQISASMVIVADFSVLFTTRDWDVCGTASAVAGAIPFAAGLR